MTTVALQIGKEGLSWAYMPECLTTDEDHPVEGRSVRWPRGVEGFRAELPEDMQDRFMAYQLVLQLVADADDILVAVEEDADLRLVGAVDVALEAPGCYVSEVQPHKDGAVGLMRAHVEEVLRNSPVPPEL